MKSKENANIETFTFKMTVKVDGNEFREKINNGESELFKRSVIEKVEEELLIQFDRWFEEIKQKKIFVTWSFGNETLIQSSKDKGEK